MMLTEVANTDNPFSEVPFKQARYIRAANAIKHKFTKHAQYCFSLCNTYGIETQESDQTLKNRERLKQEIKDAAEYLIMYLPGSAHAVGLQGEIMTVPVYCYNAATVPRKWVVTEIQKHATICFNLYWQLEDMQKRVD